MVSDGTVGGVAADLGCGHGLLALGLVTGGRVDAAVGIDRSAPEVDVARENVRRAREAIEAGDAASAPTALPVDVRLGDGAEVAHRGRRRRLPHRRRRRRPNHVRHPRRRATP